MERQDIYNSFEISTIFKKVVQEVPLTDHEQEILNKWLQKDKKNIIFYENLKDDENLADAIKKQYSTDTNYQFKLVERKIIQKRKIKFIRMASIAASLALAIGAGTWFYINSKVKEPKLTLTTLNGDVLPGSNKATIKLSSGQSIDLDNHQGIHITDTGFAYDDGKNIAKVSKTQSATLITPRGGQYQITLSDGTKVLLNANSSLQYPLLFGGNLREVYLTGEGYFEVAHNPAKPFIVKTNVQHIKVLGTAFNIRAYAEKQYTTLVRGSVSVNLNGSPSTKMLKPGEQAISSDNTVTIEKVDVQDYVAWKDGLIAGTSVELKDIANDIERWYDVDFIYPVNFKNSERAYININRNEKLSSILKAIENTYGVKASIKGREVFIK